MGRCHAGGRGPSVWQAGAAGVLRKTAKLDVLLACLRKVARGATWMEEELAHETERPVRLAHSPLTARELQVTELVERGIKNKDIGEALGIRTGTVKIHLKHIFERPESVAGMGPRRPVSRKKAFWRWR